LQAPDHVYDNMGFQSDGLRPPPYNQKHGVYPHIPQDTPSYVSVTPKPVINTHQTVTPVTPATPQRMGQKKGGKKCPWKTMMCATLCVLAILGVVALLLWYFLYYQCLLGRSCSNGGKCLSLSQWCDGVQDCPKGEDESRCFRLNGRNSMLESFSRDSHKWMPVCAENWDDSHGRSVCEQMGYRRQDYVSFTETSAGSLASGGYVKLKSESEQSSRIQSKLTYSKSCSTRVVSLQCIECGKSLKGPSSRVVGGTEAVVGAWPWQVSLQVYPHQHICGGSIISPDWILSAAHCFQGHNSVALRWRVLYGDVSLKRLSYTASSAVSKIISHEKFDPTTNDNDIALLKLTRPLKFSSRVKPVCLPNVGVDLSAERQAWITGWGALRSSGPGPDILNQAQVTIYSRETCNQPRVLDGEVTETMICAGKLEGGVDTCQGDSGGPLVVKEGDVWWLAGDTSWGIGCALRNKPGVYGNVTYFLDWVYTHMKND
ncbi:transmembrane protease serine 2, partial [Halichoeres trimaculatus]|uniref:transmembrane protease serine 2 n=1 Tax=Halichoeres trimaculatus TaxID=147232 RepID=UPI003D9DB8D3